MIGMNTFNLKYPKKKLKLSGFIRAGLFFAVGALLWFFVFVRGLHATSFDGLSKEPHFTCRGKEFVLGKTTVDELTAAGVELDFRPLDTPNRYKTAPPPGGEEEILAAGGAVTCTIVHGAVSGSRVEFTVRNRSGQSARIGDCTVVEIWAKSEDRKTEEQRKKKGNSFEDMIQLEIPMNISRWNVRKYAGKPDAIEDLLHGVDEELWYYGEEWTGEACYIFQFERDELRTIHIDMDY